MRCPLATPTDTGSFWRSDGRGWGRGIGAAAVTSSTVSSVAPPPPSVALETTPYNGFIADTH